MKRGGHGIFNGKFSKVFGKKAQSRTPYHDTIKNGDFPSFQKSLFSTGNHVIPVLSVFLAVLLVAIGVVSFYKWRENQQTRQADMMQTVIQEDLLSSHPSMQPVVQEDLSVPDAEDTLDSDMLAQGISPADRGVTQLVYSGYNILDSYSRSSPINFLDPYYYQEVPGVLSFRGNNFRNASSFGTVDVTQKKLKQVWEYREIGTKASTSTYDWSGTGWTGQPAVVQWSEDVRSIMNLYENKKQKTDLTEVIIAAMDGYIYFFDLDDGKKTRDPIHLGGTIKGSLAIDPRGFPLLYVGQGDDNSFDGNFGFYIYSLIDSSRIYVKQAKDDQRAFRQGWGGCDSSPIIDKEADTMIFPNENGMIYTLKLNTQFDPAAGTISIAPESIDWAYRVPETTVNDIGLESSMAIYGQYGYVCDNGGNLICLDLNTMQMKWMRNLKDDSDVTPVLSLEDGVLYLYVGTEVDWQQDEREYKGDAYTYKINAWTGEIIWQNSYPCFTHNGETRDGDVNGGVMGTPISGKKNISNLVIFSYCQTEAVRMGNKLVAYEKSTGDVKWTYSMNAYSWSSPVDVYDEQGNAYIVICDSRGQVHLVDAATGERLDYIQLSRGGTEEEIQNVESSPAIFNGKIVVGSRSGNFYRIDIL